MATSEENKSVKPIIESATTKTDTGLFNTGLSREHLIFANEVKNRGSYISHKENIVSKHSCDRCAAHRRNSLTDLRAFSANPTSVHHHHHSSCPKYKGRTLSRSSRSKQHTITEPKQSAMSPRPPKAPMLSPLEQSITYEPQIATKFASSVTIKQDKPKSRIPVIQSTAISSPSLPRSSNRMIFDTKTSMIPRVSTTHSLSASRHSIATVDRSESETNDDKDEFLRSG